MPDLHNYLTLADMQPFFDNARGGDVTEAWRQVYFRQLDEIMHPRLGAFFKALKAEGRVIPIPNSAGYSCRTWNAWNAVARLTDASRPEDSAAALDRLAGVFAHRLTFDITYPYDKVLEKQGAAAAKDFDKAVIFKQEVDKFSTGTYRWFVFSHESCRETDLPLTISFKDWVPTGGYITDKGSIPVPSIAPAKLQETVVVLKTGNLLVNDWFRIQEFTDALREKDFAVGSRQGREDQARYYAEQFGVISVSVGNSCPGIYQDGNQLVVGYHNDEESDIHPRLTPRGSVCTDLWAATFVEYETLVDIVARKLPDTAKQVVDAYLAGLGSGSYGLHRITVEPGTYYLYHYGDYGHFVKIAKTAGVKLEPSIDKPYFVLSKERLVPATA